MWKFNEIEAFEWTGSVDTVETKKGQKETPRQGWVMATPDFYLTSTGKTLSEF